MARTIAQKLQSVLETRSRMLGLPDITDEKTMQAVSDLFKNESNCVNEFYTSSFSTVPMLRILAEGLCHPNCKVTKLTIQQKSRKIEGEEAMAFCKVIFMSLNSKLVSLTLISLPGDDDLFCRCMKEAFTQESNRINELNILLCGIAPQVCQFLADTLQHPSNRLTKLSFGVDERYSEFQKHVELNNLFRSFSNPNCSQLESLALRALTLEDPQIRLLLGQIQQNPSKMRLQVLDLSSNRISGANAMESIGLILLEENNQLKSLYVGNNPIGTRALTTLLDCLKHRSCNLRSISLGNILQHIAANDDEGVPGEDKLKYIAQLIRHSTIRELQFTSPYNELGERLILHPCIDNLQVMLASRRFEIAMTLASVNTLQRVRKEAGKSLLRLLSKDLIRLLFMFISS
jgi:hypothetical protein